MKTAIYIRANKTNQIAQQLFRLFAQASDKNYEVALKNIYTDSGSSNRIYRDGLVHMLFDANNGEFSKVLVTNYDRLARSDNVMKNINTELLINDISIEVVG